MATSFFIFFPARSGSTFLVSLLSSHPDIHCEAEVFAVNFAGGQRSRLPQFATELATRTFLDNLYSSARKAAGFKFKYPRQYEMYPDVFNYLFERRAEVRCIILYRANLLKAAISKANQMRLRALGEPANLVQSNPAELAPLEVDLEWVVHSMTKIANNNARCREIAQDFPQRLIITYEELMTRPDVAGDTVCRFLQVPSYPLTADTRKITSDSLPASVANYRALVDRLRGTPFEVYLDEPPARAQL